MAPDPNAESDAPRGADPNAKTPTPVQGGHIVSNHAWRIRALGQEIVAAANNRLTPAQTTLNSADVGIPGFSIIGIPLQMAHSSMRGEASGYIDKARQALTSWQDGLDTIAQTWDKAEQSNTFHTK